VRVLAGSCAATRLAGERQQEQPTEGEVPSGECHHRHGRAPPLRKRSTGRHGERACDTDAVEAGLANQWKLLSGLSESKRRNLDALLRQLLAGISSR